MPFRFVDNRRTIYRAEIANNEEKQVAAWIIEITVGAWTIGQRVAARKISAFQRSRNCVTVVRVGNSVADSDENDRWMRESLRRWYN